MSPFLIVALPGVGIALFAFLYLLRKKKAIPNNKIPTNDIIIVKPIIKPIGGFDGKEVCELEVIIVNGVGSKEVVQTYSESSLISSKSISLSPLNLYLTWTAPPFMKLLKPKIIINILKIKKKNKFKII